MFLNSEKARNVQTSFEYIAMISDSTGRFVVFAATFHRKQLQVEKHYFSQVLPPSTKGLNERNTTCVVLVFVFCFQHMLPHVYFSSHYTIHVARTPLYSTDISL